MQESIILTEILFVHMESFAFHNREIIEGEKLSKPMVKDELLAEFISALMFFFYSASSSFSTHG